MDRNESIVMQSLYSLIIIIGKFIFRILNLFSIKITSSYKLIHNENKLTYTEDVFSKSYLLKSCVEVRYSCASFSKIRDLRAAKFPQISLKQ